MSNDNDIGDYGDYGDYDDYDDYFISSGGQILYITLLLLLSLSSLLSKRREIERSEIERRERFSF